MDAGHSKLYLQLLSLSGEDLNAARRFLETSLPGKHSPEFRLFNLLLPISSHEDAKKPDKKDLFKRLFPQEKGFDEHKDKRVRNLMSKLSKLLEEFLIHRELDGDPLLRQRLLVRAYQKRNASALFFKETEVQKERLEAGGHRGADYFSELAWLHSALYFHPDTMRFKANHDAFAAAAEALELSFTLALLCWQAESVSRKRVLKEAPASRFLETVLDAARQHFAAKNPVIQMFLYLVETEQPPDLELLKKTVLDCQPLLNEFERSLAFKMLVNYTIPNANRGGQSQTEALHDLFKAGLEQGMIYRKGAMDTLRFTNIAITGAAAGDFEWASGFIEKYKTYLNKKDRDKAVLLSEAYLHYYRAVRLGRRPEDFKKALECLNLIKRADEIIELQARSLQLRASYEACPPGGFAPEMPGILALASHFKEYLLRENHLSDELKHEFIGFVAYYKELANLKGSLKALRPAQIARFKNRLEQATSIRFKHWLEERAAEL